MESSVLLISITALQLAATVGPGPWLSVTFHDTPPLPQSDHNATCIQELTLTFGSETRLRTYHVQNVIAPSSVLIGGPSGEVTSWTNQQTVVCSYQEDGDMGSLSVRCNRTVCSVLGTVYHASKYYSYDAIHTPKVMSPSNTFTANAQLMTEQPAAVSYPSTKRSRLRRQAIVTPRTYKVEVIVLVDYSIYKRYYDRLGSSQDTESAKRDEAISDIKYYFAHTLNEINLRYKVINEGSARFDIVPVKYYIAKSASASPWTETLAQTVSGKENRLVNASQSLLELQDWLAQHISTLSPYDHAITFTALDLYGKGTKGKVTSVKGASHVGGICSYFALSIVEDHATFNSISIATHELAHNLGAKHDGEGNTCLAEDQYIMTPSIEFTAGATYKNLLRFSPCTTQSFDNQMNKLNNARSNCLLVTGADSPDTVNISVLPGRKFSLDQQCQNIYGSRSYFCGTQKDTDAICQDMICHDPAKGSCYTTGGTAAYRGTTCGNGKWCENRKCVHNANAPSANEECVFGDTRAPVRDNQTCSQVIPDSPQLCYHQINKELCCGSCTQVQQSVNLPEYANCTYGNRAQGCALRHCQNSDNIALCCQTCFEVYIKPNHREPVASTLGPALTQSVTSKVVTSLTPTTQQDASQRLVPVTQKLVTDIQQELVTSTVSGGTGNGDNCLGSLIVCSVLVSILHIITRN